MERKQLKERMKFMEIKNKGLLCLLAVLFFHLHLVSTASSSPSPLFPTALNQEQDVKDKQLMDKLSSRVGTGKEISVSRRGGGGGHGGGHGGRGSRGGSNGHEPKGGGGAAAVIPLYAAGGAMNPHKNSHHNGSNNTGSPTALVMLLIWVLLFWLHFFLYM